MNKRIKKIFYGFSALALSALLVVLFMPKASTVSADSFTVGNDATSRSQLDTRSNFTAVDTNHSASMDGQITSFSYYATNSNPFRFVVVDNAGMVKWVSDEITPTTAPGANTYTPPTPVDVSTGDNVGLYFTSTGTIPYEATGSTASFTAQDAGMPTVGSTLTYDSSESRTYSFVAYGNTMPSGTLMMGTDATARSQLDTFSNFTVLDTNHPSTVNGQITSFSYYATNSNPFRFVVVDNADMVKWVSDAITPSTAPGANTYTPPSPVDVSTGDNVALYFSSTGTIPYEATGASAYYTPTDSGMPTTGATLTYEGSEGRTYSFAAYGSETTTPPPPPPPPPSVVNFPGFTYGQIDYTAGDLHRVVSFFAQSNRNTRPYLGNGTFIYKDANGDWYNVDIRYVAVQGSDTYFAGRVTDSSNADWKNQWLYAKVHDGGASGDQISGELVRGTQALLHFVRNSNLTDPSSGPFDVTSGDLMVVSGLNFNE